MRTLLDAAHPQYNATVRASAGTGKTWLLVTRIIRLLLGGARPEGILAVTFTRKAAAEMQARLFERLLEYAGAPDEALCSELSRIAAPDTPAAVSAARNLYELLLSSNATPRITTFHAFCHDLLKQFPLEADVTPGFDLIESTRALQAEALDALYATATLNPDAAAGSALEFLYERFGSESTKNILDMFLDHRGDWWAYTQDEPDPVQFARDRLCRELNVSLDVDFAARFFAASLPELIEFADLLDRHHLDRSRIESQLLRATVSDSQSAVDRFDAVKSIFLRADNCPRVRKQTQVQTKKMGAANEQRFLALHESLSTRAAATVDALQTQFTARLNDAWFTAGAVALHNFQQLKEERRVLDFTDLEWKTFLLLSSGENTHWVQYKLDRRIDHLLIDEFQDTSPIQWHMLQPLLHELASTQSERNRSVFLVGDEKQSIYQFRRADPRLLPAAQQWLTENMRANTFSLDASRRSAPAIMDFVNAVFARPALADRFPEFPVHATHHTALWGRVEIFPLFDDNAQPTTAPASELRNPLLRPREARRRGAYDEEGALIAATIQRLIDTAVVLGANPSAQPIRYSDVMILVRNRTHVAAYERALRTRGIPYFGAERGTLLQCREICDLVHLLDVLTTPFNNLELATVLRSPIFDCSEDDLSQLALAPERGTWIERLNVIAPALPADHPLRRAHDLIRRWSEAAGQLPVHDLIDRIYSEGRLVSRFVAAAPPHLRGAIKHNLAQFIDLALELDSGRFPSLGRFVDSIRDAQRGATDGPDIDTTGNVADAVRILTVHAAKGLESPVVFLADAASDGRRSPVANVFVSWEPEYNRPDRFYLTGSKAAMDPMSRALTAANEAKRDREDLNLLYVALTRAKQMIFVSGCASAARVSRGWYDVMRSGLAALVDERETLSFESGTMPPAAPVAPASNRDAPTPIDTRLGHPINAPASRREISPSRDDRHWIERPQTIDSHGVDYGIAIHKMIEHLTSDAQLSVAAIQATIAMQIKRIPHQKEIAAWWAEAEAVVRAPELRELFAKEHALVSYSEVPLVYLHDDRVVHGIADRIVVRQNDVAVIDFKSHRVANVAAAQSLATAFRSQLRWYTRAASALWPGKKIRAFVIFTSIAVAIELDDLDSVEPVVT